MWERVKLFSTQNITDIMMAILPNHVFLGPLKVKFNPFPHTDAFSDTQTGVIARIYIIIIHILTFIEYFHIFA